MVCSGDPEIIGAMAKVISQTTSNLTTVSQYAAIEALTGDQSSIEIMRQAFEERLNTIYPLLNEVPGFEAIKPQGAFYLFPNVKKAMEIKGYTDVTEFTTAILEEAEVALVTGAGLVPLKMFACLMRQIWIPSKKLFVDSRPLWKNKPIGSLALS